MDHLFSLPVKRTGDRLDAFLVEYAFHHPHAIPALSRADFSRAIQSGQITVNGKPTKPSATLKTGDTITLQLTSPETALFPNPHLPIPILFENRDFLIIDKPAGTQTHPSATEQHHTVANWIVARFPDMANVGEDRVRPGIVHRLDKDTSGLMIIAKNQETFLAFKDLFQHREIQKTYTALVHGHIHPQKGSIDKPLARAKTLAKQATGDRYTRGTLRPALTEYAVIKRYQDFDMIEARPKTGRTHQIRVHLASTGHPIVGDKLYSTKITRKADRELSDGPKRHLLHAKRLEFTLFGKNYNFSSPLPEDFTRFLETMK